MSGNLERVVQLKEKNDTLRCQIEELQKQLLDTQKQLTNATKIIKFLSNFL